MRLTGRLQPAIFSSTRVDEKVITIYTNTSLPRIVVASSDSCGPAVVTAWDSQKMLSAEWVTLEACTDESTTTAFNIEPQAPI